MISISLLLLLLSFSKDAMGLFDEGILMIPQKLDSSLIYLDKFCFLPGAPGKIEFASSAAVGGAHFLFFDDELWNKYFHNDDHVSCNAIVAAAQQNAGKAVDEPLPSNRIVKQFTVSVDKRSYWYAGVVNCNGPIELEYAVSFLNEAAGWQQQYSCDQQGTWTVHVIIFFLTGFLSLVHFKAHANKEDSDDHFFFHTSQMPTVKGVHLALLGFTIGNALFVIHYTLFAADGIGFPLLALIANCCHTVVQVTILCVFLLIAEGYTVSQVYLTGRKLLLGVLVCYLCAHGLFLFWDKCCRDPSVSFYAYESFPGFLDIAVRLLIAAWFAKRCKLTHEAEEDPFKRRFYFFFCIGGLIWFLTLPVMVLIAAMMPPYHRAEAVVVMRLTIDFVTTLGLVVMLWPSNAIKFFNVNRRYDLLQEAQRDDDI